MQESHYTKEIRNASSQGPFCIVGRGTSPFPYDIGGGSGTSKIPWHVLGTLLALIG